MNGMFTFVGREKEVDILSKAHSRAASGNGSFVFIQGTAGMGKSILIQMLEASVKSNAEFAHSRFLYGYCYNHTGGQNAYHPFVELLETLLKTETVVKGDLDAIIDIVRETGTDWLNLIPGFGPAFGAGLNTMLTIGEIYADTPRIDQSKNLIEQYAKVITKIASRYEPLVLVIEDAHWLDSASCRLMMRLARSISTLPILVIVSYRPNFVTEEQPFNATRNDVLSKGVAQIIRLGGLSTHQIQTYLHKRFGSSLTPKLSGWIYHLCEGYPLFVTQYLSLLEQEGIISDLDGKYVFTGDIEHVKGRWELSGKMADAIIPASIEILLEQRISRLIEEEMELLKLGSVQGKEFMSLILASLTSKDETDILRKMQRVIEQHRVIGFATGEKGSLVRSELYQFEHLLMQRAFYQKLGPRERIIHHGRIARVLEGLLKDANVQDQKLVLEIGYHYDLAQNHLLAAKYYLAAAQSLFSSGALLEAAEIGERALRNVRSSSGNFLLHVEIIELLLVIIENRWYLPSYEKDRLKVFELIQEGENAASKTDDKIILSRMYYLRGIFTLLSVNYAEGVNVMRKALQLAEQGNDPISKFIIMSNLGYWMRSGDFTAGLEMQRSALTLYETEIRTTDIGSSSEIMRRLYVLQRQLGIGEFDQGNLGSALLLLEQSLSGMKQIKTNDDLVPLLNNLSQVYMAIGLFSRSESCLKEALRLSLEEDVPHNWNAYNVAMLGRLYLEQGQFDDALDQILKGLQESRITQVTWQLPLIRTLYSELLISPLSPYQNLAMAKEQLDLALNEATEYGLNRSTIVALSLSGLVSLYRGEVQLAFQHSSQAIELLEELGNVPAIRREEIYFTHYQISRAANLSDIAIEYLGRARTIVEEKAMSLDDPEFRQSFLLRVPLNAMILQAVERTSD